MKIAIVGSGVIGLSVASRLTRLGHPVTIVSGQGPLQTTSAVSAAYWGPYFVGDYEREWAIQTWHELVQLASSPETASQSGTSIVEFNEWLGDSDRDELDRQLRGETSNPLNLGEVSLRRRFHIGGEICQKSISASSHSHHPSRSIFLIWEKSTLPLRFVFAALLPECLTTCSGWRKRCLPMGALSSLKGEQRGHRMF